MDLNLKDENLHHAYCLIGNNSEVTKQLEVFLDKKLGFCVQGNPDFLYGEYDVLNIDDARNLNKLHDKRPVLSDKKIFVVCTNFITEQAQNAMLKMFEEPRGDTHFFLIMPRMGLIDTLRSRMIILMGENNDDSLFNAEEFLKMEVGRRIGKVKEFMDSISEDDLSKMEVVKFINALQFELRKHIKGSKEYPAVIEEIENVRQYALDQSPSLKMILEHIAIITPVIK